MSKEIMYAQEVTVKNGEINFPEFDIKIDVLEKGDKEVTLQIDGSYWDVVHYIEKMYKENRLIVPEWI